MIRLIIIIVLLFLIWVLFVSDFTKQRKIVLAVLAVLLCGLGVWLDGYGDNPKEGVVDRQNLVSCGVTAKHSYRSNFDISVCFSNSAERGTIKRVRFAVIAEKCSSPNECVQLDRVERDVPFVLASQNTGNLVQNLSFRNVEPQEANDSKNSQIRWSAEVMQVKATR